jgi:predicted SnoaL-like aldol condensation-catalyzing enzyme
MAARLVYSLEGAVGTRSMTEQEQHNVQTVMRHFLEACGQSRPEVWLEIMHPDYFIHHPWCQPGRDSYMASSAKYWGNVAPPQYEFLHVLAQGDLVMVHYIERSTMTGPVFGAQAVGKSYEKKGFAIYRFENGMMREGWSQEDDLGFMQQLGITRYEL